MKISCLSLPPEERGRHTVHPASWVLKDLFKWSKCGLYLASQEIWASLRPSRRIYWEHVDPCAEKDGCLRELPYRYIYAWPVTLSLSRVNAKPGGFALGSAVPRTLVLPAVPGYILQWHILLQHVSKAAVDCMGTWQKSIENIYSASPVFLWGYQLSRYNGSRICSLFFLSWE